MAMEKELVLLSEGYCPLGHGRLGVEMLGAMRSACPECKCKWELRVDHMGQWATAVSFDGGKGITLVFPPKAPGESGWRRNFETMQYFVERGDNRSSEGPYGRIWNHNTVYLP